MHEDFTGDPVGSGRRAARCTQLRHIALIVMSLHKMTDPFDANERIRKQEMFTLLFTPIGAEFDRGR
jgi:hypothetical protein